MIRSFQRCVPVLKIAGQLGHFLIPCEGMRDQNTRKQEGRALVPGLTCRNDCGGPRRTQNTINSVSRRDSSTAGGIMDSASMVRILTQTVVNAAPSTGHSVSRHYGFVEGQPRLRTVPANEVINGNVDNCPATPVNEDLPHGRLDVFEIG